MTTTFGSNEIKVMNEIEELAKEYHPKILALLNGFTEGVAFYEVDISKMNPTVKNIMDTLENLFDSLSSTTISIIEYDDKKVDIEFEFKTSEYRHCFSTNLNNFKNFIYSILKYKETICTYSSLLQKFSKNQGFLSDISNLTSRLNSIITNYINDVY